MSAFIWEPSEQYKEQSSIYQFQQFVEKKLQLKFENYQEFWQWSVDDLEGFWESISQFFKINFHRRYEKVLSQSEQGFIGNKWFEGATLSYAEHIFSHANSLQAALICKEENQKPVSYSWLELERKVKAIQHYLRQKGVGLGDRVVGVLKNTADAIAVFLAVNSLGAIWSSCSPDFGQTSIFERFNQISPKLLFADRFYTYQGKVFEIDEAMQALSKQLSSLEDELIFIGDARWQEIMDYDSEEALTFAAVAFDHPIWILYSSGTTGIPKAITHSTGGNLMEHYKALALHQNVQAGDRLIWYATTGWMMWNYALSSLLVGATLCIYEGALTYPNQFSFWDFVSSQKIDHVGAGAAFYIALQQLTLSQPRFQPKTIGSTGSPLPAQTFEWLHRQFPSSQLISLSGGTDVCSAFLSGNPTLPVYAGEIQCLTLGSKIMAFNEQGHPVTDEVGELVIALPMPSMPLYFWNDTENVKYLASYFEKYPGVWCHGDWIKFTEHNGITVYGRSDATLNRGGVRIGTAEIYQVLLEFDAIEDGLVISEDYADGTSKMSLYVQMRAGFTLSQEYIREIKLELKRQYSPRHIPDEILQVPLIPYTQSGKKLEIPVKKIMMGAEWNKVISLDVLKNPSALDYWINLKNQSK